MSQAASHQWLSSNFMQRKKEKKIQSSGLMQSYTVAAYSWLPVVCLSVLVTELLEEMKRQTIPSLWFDLLPLLTFVFSHLGLWTTGQFDITFKNKSHFPGVQYRSSLDSVQTESTVKILNVCFHCVFLFSWKVKPPKPLSSHCFAYSDPQSPCL